MAQLTWHHMLFFWLTSCHQRPALCQNVNTVWLWVRENMVNLGWHMYQNTPSKRQGHVPLPPMHVLELPPPQKKCKTGAHTPATYGLSSKGSTTIGQAALPAVFILVMGNVEDANREASNIRKCIQLWHYGGNLLSSQHRGCRMKVKGLQLSPWVIIAKLQCPTICHNQPWHTKPKAISKFAKSVQQFPCGQG